MSARRTLDRDAIRAIAAASDRAQLQQRAGRWVAELVTDAGSFVFHPEVSISPFEIVRNRLMQACADALGDIDLVHAISGPALLAVPEGPRIERMARWLGRQDIVAAEPVRLGKRARHVAYAVREEAKRVAPRFPPARRECFMLAVPRMAGHVADMLPVALTLREEGKETVFAGGEFADSVRPHGFTLLPYDHVDAPRALVAIVRLLRFVHESLRRFSNAPIVEQLLARIVRTELRECALVLAHVTLGLWDVLAKIRPEIVLVGNPYTLEGRVAAMLARKRNLRTAALEHGSIFKDDPRWAHCSVDTVLVWGQPSARALRSAGLRDEQISIVGAPRLDAFIGQSHALKPRRVLVASSGGGDQVSHAEHSKFIETVVAAADATVGVEWVIKLHPKDREDLYLPVLAKHPLANVSLVRSGVVGQGTEIFEYLRGARVLVTVLSTAALDAMLVGVPVISVLVDPLQTARRMERVEFLSRGAVRQVGTTLELADAVLDAIEGCDFDSVSVRATAYASEHFANAGNACRVAAAALVSTASHQKS